RHRRREVRAADQQVDAGGVPGEVHGGLAGRVGPAHDVDVLVDTAGRLGGGGAVEHPPAGEVGQTGRVEHPVGDPGGQYHRVRGDLAAVAETQQPGPA